MGGRKVRGGRKDMAQPAALEPTAQDSRINLLRSPLRSAFDGQPSGAVRATSLAHRGGGCQCGGDRGACPLLNERCVPGDLDEEQRVYYPEPLQEKFRETALRCDMKL